MIRIGFKRPGDSIIGKLIAKHDFPGTYCHCAIWFSESIVCEAHIEDGVRFHRYDPDAAWDFITIATTPDQERQVREFCEVMAGDPYDCCGIAALAGVPLAKQDDEAWFCSELVTCAIQLIGQVPDLVSYQTSPNSLYIALGGA